MKAFTLLLALTIAITARSQNTINNYKYVLVPERFDIFKMDNQYNINSLTKSLLEGYGFKAYMTDEELPADLVSNKCSALKADLIEKKKFLATGITLILKDCQGNVVYKSEEGKSREKEWQAAYMEAVRNAFLSLNTANYKYDSTAAATTSATPAANNTTATTAATATTVTTVTTAATPATLAENKDVLYAQANANGYQLIDTSPKKIMTLLKTSQPDNFLADDGTFKGIVFRKNGEWLFEYYKDDKLISQKLNIKF